MGIVWEAYHKQVPCPWGSLESPWKFHLFPSVVSPKLTACDRILPDGFDRRLGWTFTMAFSKWLEEVLRCLERCAKMDGRFIHMKTHHMVDFYRMLNGLNITTHGAYRYMEVAPSCAKWSEGIRKKHELKVGSEIWYYVTHPKFIIEQSISQPHYQRSRVVSAGKCQNFLALKLSLRFPLLKVTFESVTSPSLRRLFSKIFSDTFVFAKFLQILVPTIWKFLFLSQTSTWNSWNISESSAFLLAQIQRRWRLFCCAHSVGADSESLFNLRCDSVPKMVGKNAHSTLR